ncbi:hypothetical protein ABT147_07695 [Streptomyces sp. NPDC001868]|uniref:hypothetical protein n=1 Tax=Streptomyces sp. NPDC001868 TaxID=3154401 RepID=UPI0033193514
MAAVGNGNPHNVDSFRRPARFTWHGKALAILRPGKRPGLPHPHREVLRPAPGDPRATGPPPAFVSS